MERMEQLINLDTLRNTCYIMLLLLSQSLSNVASSKFCGADADSRLGHSSSCFKITNNVLESEDEARVETGFEFMEILAIAGFGLNLDSNLFYGTDTEAVDRRSGMSTQALTQMFIRNVKGQDMEKGSFIILSGTDTSKKIAWTFDPFQMKHLVSIELKLYELLRTFQKENGDVVIPSLESYLRDIEESSLRAIQNIESSNKWASNPEDPHLYIASHPILIYRMIRRFAEDLQTNLGIVQSIDSEFIEMLYNVVNPDQVVFPTMEDLNDSLEMISRMQQGNDLNTNELARGILGKVNTDVQLNALHCLEIGSYYLDSSTFDYSIQWLHTSLETARKSNFLKVYPELEEYFVLALNSAIEEHNDNFNQMFINLWDPWVFNTTVTIPYDPSKYTRRIYQLSTQASQMKNRTNWNWAVRANFIRVCSGENLQTEIEKSALKCWYHRHHNHYWYINPLKTELLNMNPPVFQFYDFLGEKLMGQIKAAAVSQLQRSKVEKVVDQSHATRSIVDYTRTSSQTWLYDQDKEVGNFLQTLTRRLELLSGLEISPESASDAYQCATYGPSHYYDAHIDSVEDPRRWEPNGNRLTTIMGYINDVKVGGKTGFPVLGIAADPIKGSIVMWDNVKKNVIDRDERTWHGGCPVVLGIKWILNKWVNTKDNMFTFPCSLNPDE